MVAVESDGVVGYTDTDVALWVSPRKWYPHSVSGALPLLGWAFTLNPS